MVDLPDLYIKTQVKTSLKLPRVALIIFYVKMIVLYCHNFKYQRFLSRNLFLPLVSKLLTKDLFFLKNPATFPPNFYTCEHYETILMKDYCKKHIVPFPICYWNGSIFLFVQSVPFFDYMFSFGCPNNTSISRKWNTTSLLVFNLQTFYVLTEAYYLLQISYFCKMDWLEPEKLHPRQLLSKSPTEHFWTTSDFCVGYTWK